MVETDHLYGYIHFPYKYEIKPNTNKHAFVHDGQCVDRRAREVTTRDGMRRTMAVESDSPPTDRDNDRIRSRPWRPKDDRATIAEATSSARSKHSSEVS